MPSPNPVVSVRVSPSERDLLEVAAGHARTNLSDFIRRKALDAAEIEVLDHRRVTIPAADWARFEQWVDSPAQAIPALQDLTAIKPVWRD